MMISVLAAFVPGFLFPAALGECGIRKGLTERSLVKDKKELRAHGR